MGLASQIDAARVCVDHVPQAMIAPPPLPLPRLSIGITGHREANPSFAANQPAIERALLAIFDRIDALTGAQAQPVAATRLHGLLANGADQMAARDALARGWELVAPLPYGRLLNRAINAAPLSHADAMALLDDEMPSDPAVAARAGAIRDLERQAALFELADRDEAVAALFLAMLEAPGDHLRAREFEAENAQAVALAGRVVIEQADLVIGIWDGRSSNLGGGTGHTIAIALMLGAPVLLMDPARPDAWSIVTTPEACGHRAKSDLPDSAALAALVEAALFPDGGAGRGHADQLMVENWAGRSSRNFLGYRMIERLFGGGGGKLIQTYERPEAIATGSGAAMLAAARAIPGADRAMTDELAGKVLPDFAWADGISTWLSDAYRSSMIASFALSALAVLVGLAYQPLGFDHGKWLFAGAEFLILLQILFFTWFGNRRRWHARWFDTRRVAEYLRHAPVLLPLGIARPAARWPRGPGLSWPEYHARHRLRALGLPRATVSRDYLRSALANLIAPHVAGQRDYHRGKAARLARVHKRLDRIAERFFVAAVASVTIYLVIVALAWAGLVASDLPYRSAKLFTFMGVAFPTLGATVAAMRYFGDFERFAGISETTAEKLAALAERIELLLTGPDNAIDYAAAAQIGHALEEITVSEIESWQSVFGGKHIALPA